MSELPKHFDPAAIEARWYAHWEEEGLFRPERPEAEPWTIVNPPPNVTGKLHIGHALDNTLQDILVRHQRMLGKDALWVVGTDHAGIATQMVVERQLNEKQQKRTDFSREEFIEKVWEWKDESGGEITGQLRRLGCSMDWSNERFTMDEGFTKAVTKVFVDLYNDGLIYRDKRLVNWDPGLKTAISDLEVETQDMPGKFWHFKYPLADGLTLDNGQDYIEVATTRPETMLADMAVAVHPSDERYANVVGKQVILPITGRRVTIVADEHADPELGSGAVKITPGHDFNDFEVGKRAGFAASEMFNMLDAEANVCQTADGLVPEEFIGLHRFRRDDVDGARELVVARLKDLGCLIPHITKDKEGETQEQDAEPRTIATPYGDRSNVVIEPWLTDQWYVDAAKLAVEPMAKVRSGEIDIVPKSWEKTFFNWMENIQPWCVSRQLWWGHRIPAWFGPKIKDDKIVYDQSTTEVEVFVAHNKHEAELQAIKRYKALGRPIAFTTPERLFDVVKGEGHDPDYVFLFQETDVLDTWFSSGLWPFATLGWPEETHDLKRHYPNNVLISGFDILFFWDARMMMQGLHLMGEVPFHTLYLHGLVRAADGQKMSKSKGNTVDPLGLIDQYGADALRFFMAAMESQGRDIKMDEKRVEGYRNFATKLWNAARFCQSNGIGASNTLAAPDATLPVNRWIISETVEALTKLNKALDDLRFDGAADAIYHFVWDKFCDWYLELIKPGFVGDVKGEIDAETKVVAGWVLDQILVMLHPFMPFITEELWHAMGERKYDIIVAKWPEPKAEIDSQALQEIGRVIELTSAIRTQRAEIGISPSVKLPLAVLEASDEDFTIMQANTATIQRIARVLPARIEFQEIEGLEKQQAELGSVSLADKFQQIDSVSKYWKSSLQIPTETTTLVVRIDGFADLSAEIDRLSKSLEAAEKEVMSLDKRLSNPQFVEKAKPEAVEKARADHAEKAAEAERLKAALERLG